MPEQQDPLRQDLLTVRRAFSDSDFHSGPGEALDRLFLKASEAGKSDQQERGAVEAQRARRAWADADHGGRLSRLEARSVDQAQRIDRLDARVLELETFCGLVVRSQNPAGHGPSSAAEDETLRDVLLRLYREVLSRRSLTVEQQP